MADANKTPAAETLTDDMIIALRREAEANGDICLADRCRDALVDTDHEDADDRTVTMRGLARAMVAAMINHKRAKSGLDPVSP